MITLTCYLCNPTDKRKANKAKYRDTEGNPVCGKHKNVSAPKGISKGRFYGVGVRPINNHTQLRNPSEPTPEKLLTTTLTGEGINITNELKARIDE